ncbi:MAG: hypothetical protein ACSHX3_13930 [Litorimonas sp.]
MIKNPKFFADALLDEEALDQVVGGVCVTLPPVQTNITLPTFSGQMPNFGSDDTKPSTDMVGGGTYGSGC